MNLTNRKLKKKIRWPERLKNQPEMRTFRQIYGLVLLKEWQKVGHLFQDALAARSMNSRSSLEKMFPPGEELVRDFDAMPSFDASISLRASLHRNPQHRWRNNHLFDIDALALTIPYCDVVVTDKEMANHVRVTGPAGRMKTSVLSQLTDLPDHV